MGWLVGAVGIENNTDRNFKDLEEMRGNAKTLKRNNRKCKEILIGPSFFGVDEIPLLWVFSPTALANKVGFGPKSAV
jgi:hypothetical protein